MIDTLEGALKAVATVGPIAREHAQKSEDGRRLSPEVVDAIADAGLWNVFAPRAVGGAGLCSVADGFEIIRSMAYEDTSAAWGLFICGSGAGIIASRLPEEGRKEVFAAGCTPMAGVFNPGGSGTRNADGSLTVSGRWPFASGVSYAHWVLANVIVLDENGAPKPGGNGMPEIASVLVPRDEVEIVDDWHVAGLRGTGSMSITMQNHPVPGHRTFNFFGAATVDEAPYKLPILSIVGAQITAMTVGLAERAVDEVIALLPTRSGPPTFQPASADPVNQQLVGRAVAAVRGARESSRSIYGRYSARLAAGEDLSNLSLRERAELHQHGVWVAETCRAVVNELFTLGGANAIYDSSVLQRVWRDINVVAQHLFFRSVNHRIVGEIALGLEVVAPLM
jgi:alkylation response protein AidB-like acyl-CoA dehydrogenase